ncbi:hypothetical protein ABK040_006875 [Willaertia magna]
MGKKKKSLLQCFPDDVICEILSYFDGTNCDSLKSLLQAINNLYLVNKKFNECSKLIFNEFFKKLLFKTFVRKVTLDLQQKIIEINDHKKIYSYLNHYFHLKTKQFKLNKEKRKPLIYDEHLDCLALKILVAGPNSVGRSSIVKRYIQNLFEEHPIVTEDRKIVTIDETQYVLQVLTSQRTRSHDVF